MEKRRKSVIDNMQEKTNKLSTQKEEEKRQREKEKWMNQKKEMEKLYPPGHVLVPET